MKDYAVKIWLALSIFILVVCTALCLKLQNKNDKQDTVSSKETSGYSGVVTLCESLNDVKQIEDFGFGAKGDLVEDSLEGNTPENASWFKVVPQRSTMYATSSVNIRKEPSKDSNKVGLLSHGNEIEISGVCDNGWYQVVYGGGVAYISGKYLTDSKPLVVSYPSYEGFIVNGGNVADKWLFKLDANYCKIPENVRSSFQRNGWRVVCTSEDLGDKFFSSQVTVQAVADRGSKTIYVEAREAAMTSILHEIGHYIDWECGWVSSTKAFMSIYKSEVDVFKSVVTTNDNNTSSATEYFAEAYQVYLEYPELLSKYCPCTYSYVVGYSGSLN